MTEETENRRMSLSDYAKNTAQIIFDSNAFLLTPTTPFKLTSGLFSPFYIDCRRTLSNADGRGKIGDFLADMIEQKIGVDQFDVVAGGVTAGVPFATMVADRLKMPLVYIRPEPKGHGKGQQIEGGDVSGKRVLLVEDLITRGTSQKKFLVALENAGATMPFTAVVCSRANDETLMELKNMKVALHALCNFDDLISFIEKSGRFSKEDIAETQDFLKDPEGWSAKAAARMAS